MPDIRYRHKLRRYECDGFMLYEVLTWGTYRVGQKSDTSRTYYIVREVSLFWPTRYIARSYGLNSHEALRNGTCYWVHSFYLPPTRPSWLYCVSIHQMAPSERGGKHLI